MIPDIPPGKLRALPDNALIVLAKEEDPAAFATRFSGKIEVLETNDLHKICRFIRQL